MAYIRVLHRIEASLFRRAAVVRRASCGHERAADFGVARARAPLLWLSLGRRCSTRFFCHRPSCRANFGRPASDVRVLHRAEASLFRRVAVVRRARCGLQRAAGIDAARARALPRWLSFWKRGSTRACCCARAVPSCARPVPYSGHCTDETPLYFGTWPWCDVPAAACNVQRLNCGARVRATALAVSGE